MESGTGRDHTNIMKKWGDEETGARGGRKEKAFLSPMSVQ